jgi:REP element-mobilizing transposase RayT
MARKLRIQYAGARYHIINRGNYRKDLFESVGAAESFLKVLAEATGKFGWKLHAYVLMRNHYHLALETPSPTLVVGMHWMQTTVASRFNRFLGSRDRIARGGTDRKRSGDSPTSARVETRAGQQDPRGNRGTLRLAFRGAELRKACHLAKLPLPWSGKTANNGLTPSRPFPSRPTRHNCLQNV